MTPPLQTATAGQFTIDADGLTGPADYLKEQGSALLAKITAGDDMVFNNTCHLSPSLELAICVRMQTDYAGWLGMRYAEVLPIPVTAKQKLLAAMWSQKRAVMALLIWLMRSRPPRWCAKS